MLKKRVIPILLYKDGRLVKSREFGNYRDVGDPLRSAQVYSDQDADELIILSIERDSNRHDFAQVLKSISSTCFVPIAAGGNIQSIKDADRLFRNGADKVVVNSAALESCSLIKDIATKYGRQAMVVSIDVKWSENYGWRIYGQGGATKVDLDLKQYLIDLEKAGAGEIILQDINRDGMMCGYNFQLLDFAKKKSNLPIIICAGAKNNEDLLRAFQFGADAVACGSLFNFGDNNPVRIKSYLKNHDIPLKRIK